jgi:hypothetical protein
MILKKMWCAKNVLHEYETRISPEISRYCDGAEGNGVEISCKSSCLNYCERREDLARLIGQIVINRMGTLIS